MRDHPFKTSASFRGGGGVGGEGGVTPLSTFAVSMGMGMGLRKADVCNVRFLVLMKKKIEKEVSKLFYAIPSLCCIFFLCNSLFNGLIV